METTDAPNGPSRRHPRCRLALFWAACLVSAVGLGAASPKPPEASFEAQGVSPMGAEIPAPQPARVQSAMFEPAPVPNQDANGPAGSIERRGGFSPRLFSSKNEFEGDGYSYGSSQQATLDARKQPAAGLGLSVPLLK